MHKIIAVVGLTGSGKSVVTEYFENKHFDKIWFGQLTIDTLAQRSLPKNEKNEKMVREELRKKHGMAAYAVLNIPRIKAAVQKCHVVIDGLYSWSEYKVLHDAFGQQLTVLCVYASPATRYKRLSTRTVRPLTFSEAQSRDYAEIENIEKGGPIAMADYTVINEDTIHYLKKQLDAVYERVFGNGN